MKIMRRILHTVFSAIIPLLLPVVSQGQVITLGAAANFTLFTSDGAIGNVPTSTSHLTGDVGTNNGGITGFGNVNGTMHNNDGATAAAAASLLLAAGQINSTVSTFFPAPLIGNGDTLDAGVYSIAGVTTLSGNLILDGGNDSNAIFIFKISAAFSSTTLSEVILINGAKACNVYWKSFGAINLASGTKMKGNVIADVGAIDLAAGVDVEGRLLSTTGAITINGIKSYLPTGCGSTLLTGPLAPPLGTTACYALFSGNGAVTSGSPTTVLIGDVGTNVGLTIGFDPLNVTGTIHQNPDVSTAACAVDLLILYTALNTLPHDIELLYPAQFGNKLVLTPHTYLLAAATVLNDTLYLNAENNPNAVFVIKITGALSTGTYANVKLVNGAQAKNVFWKVDGAVSINDYSQFKGTIVANQAAVNLNTGVVLEGRAMTTSGALNTAAVTVNMTPGCNAPLPLTWLYFTGESAQDRISLEWATTNELNNGYFTIEKSSDGEKFSKLATVKATDQSASTNKYFYSDYQPYSVSYYRISQTDNNGTVSYFNTIRLANSKGFSVSHFVSDNAISVRSLNAEPGTATITLYSIDGRKIAGQEIVLAKEATSWSMEKPKQNGVYLISIEQNGSRIYNGAVLIN